MRDHGIVIARKRDLISVPIDIEVLSLNIVYSIALSRAIIDTYSLNLYIYTRVRNSNYGEDIL